MPERLRATEEAARLGLQVDPVELVLLDHQRDTVDRCLCGWGELGRRHSEHVAARLREAGLLR